MKKTKIVATISDRMCDVSLLKRLMEAGMDVVRLNTAHQEPADSLKVIGNVRKVSEWLPIMVDTKGPEVRTITGKQVKKGERITLAGKGNPDVLVSYQNFVKDVAVGQQILVDDGEIALKIVKKEKEKVVCVVLNSGEIGKRKSVNAPGAALQLPTLTEKDVRFLKFSKKEKIDFVAHSFVRSKKDVAAVRKYVGDEIKIIAKIENHEGVENIDEILEAADGIMVARGDLGIEIPMEQIPGIQAELIRKAISKRKPVITATQMLHTMIKNPRPTRAEVNDVATAIFQGTDAVMLSGETSKGEYPVEAVETMARIAEEAERITPGFRYSPEPPEREVTAYLAESAVMAALRLPVKAVLMDAETGRTALYVAAFRGKLLINTYCYRKTVTRQLRLSFGIVPQFVKRRGKKPTFVENALQILLKKGLKKKDLVVVLAGSYGIMHGPSFIEVSTVDNLMD